MFFDSPARLLAMTMKGAGFIALAGVALIVVNELQAAEGRRVKLHVMEQVQKIERKAHREEVAQVKHEARLDSEQSARVGKAESVKYEKGDIRTCPIVRLRCVEPS